VATISNLRVQAVRLVLVSATMKENVLKIHVVTIFPSAMESIFLITRTLVVVMLTAVSMAVESVFLEV
jgi:hypothetical protein